MMLLLFILILPIMVILAAAKKSEVSINDRGLVKIKLLSLRDKEERENQVIIFQNKRYGRFRRCFVYGSGRNR